MSQRLDYAGISGEETRALALGQGRAYTPPMTAEARSCRRFRSAHRSTIILALTALSIVPAQAWAEVVPEEDAIEQQWETEFDPAVAESLATKAMLAVSLACMKQIGAVGTSADYEVIYGSVVDRIKQPPTGTPQVPRPGCVKTATDRSLDILATATSVTNMNNRYANLIEDANAGTGDFAPTSPEAEGVDKGNGSDVSYADYTDALQRRGSANTLSRWHANKGSPGFFDWDSPDRCTWSPDTFEPFGWPFWVACVRHDFNWDNTQDIESWYGKDKWNRHNKAVGDTQFRIDLGIVCRRHTDKGSLSRDICTGVADTYEWAVRENVMNTHGMKVHVYNF